MGRTAMLLVPEIALTPQMMAKFTAYFGENVAMLHSGLQLTERYDQWKRIRPRRRAGRARHAQRGVCAAAGSRTYHHGRGAGADLLLGKPRRATDTRDVAQFRCAQSGSMLLLGSATPTVETMYYAREGRYQVFPIYRRYNEKALPKVLIADLRDELRAGNETAVSERSAPRWRKISRAASRAYLFSTAAAAAGCCCAVSAARCPVPALQRSDDLSQCERTADVPLLRPQ